MTAYNNNNDAIREYDQQGQTPGELLASERKKQNRDEKSTAQALKISVHRLKSIEANHFDDFPSETYVRGHLRNYSRLLNLDEQSILDVYEASKPKPEIATDELGQVAELAVAQTNKQWWFVYVILVILVLVWVLSYWLLNSGDEPEPIVSEMPQLSNPLKDVDERSAAPVEQPQPVPESELDAALPPSLPESGNETTIVNEGADENTLVVSKITAAELVKSVMNEPQQPEVEPEPLIAEGDTLTFDFDNDCWVKVTDAEGEVLFTGLQRPGSSLTLSGKAPFRVVIGNVEGTSVVYNGEPVQLSTTGSRRDVSLRIGG